ncbi:MAG: DNA-binding protein WhiA [Eubacteriales bacterium]|nr:DNA-binding protein WhiA [Eubacteriales bacterium]
MSFTQEVKAELVAIPQGKQCCARAELAALTRGASYLAVSGGSGFSLRYRTENPAVLRRILVLLKASGAIEDKPRLLVQRRFGTRRLYVLALSHPDSRRALKDQGMLEKDEQGEEVFRPPSRQVTRRACCRRAYVRGAFLASGFIADPRRRYHAEWVLPDEAQARHLQRVLGHLGLMGRVSQRRGQGVLYLKEGDELSELLKLMDASRAVLAFENQRAEKSLKADATRAFNCDQGNLGRQLKAAGGQTAAIEKISLARGLSSLPRNLEALARLRLAKPEATIEELGQMLSPPLSKSGVQHRMRRLMQLALELKDNDMRD